MLLEIGSPKEKSLSLTAFNTGKKACQSYTETLSLTSAVNITKSSGEILLTCAHKNLKNLNDQRWRDLQEVSSPPPFASYIVRYQLMSK